MDWLIKAHQALPLKDILALLLFFGSWWGYARFARRQGAHAQTLLATTNALRSRWMLQTSRRDNRVIDGSVMQYVGSAPSFFASTTMLVLGGLLTALGTSDKASGLVQELPFAAQTSVILFDLKLMVLTSVFIYAFFRFTWSMRQNTFGALMIGAMPDVAYFDAHGEAAREEHARRAGRIIGLAAETFNDGLRAYYFSFAVISWFFSPWAFAAATLGVIYILYQREFRSDVLAVLNLPDPQPVPQPAQDPATPACAAESAPRAH